MSTEKQSERIQLQWLHTGVCLMVVTRRVQEADLPYRTQGGDKPGLFLAQLSQL